MPSNWQRCSTNSRATAIGIAGDGNMTTPFLPGRLFLPAPTFPRSLSTISSAVFCIDLAPSGDQRFHILRRPGQRDMRLELLHPHRDFPNLRLVELGELTQRLSVTNRVNAGAQGGHQRLDRGV